jgi:hypothetical protein
MKKSEAMAAARECVIQIHATASPSSRFFFEKLQEASVALLGDTCQVLGGATGAILIDSTTQ